MRFLLDSFNDFFNDWFDFPLKLNYNYMRTDIKENDKEYHLAIEIPGVNKDDIQISYKNDYLTVAVEAPEDDSQEYIHRERIRRNCARDYYVGRIDESRITAKYENGILEITVLKESIQDNKKYISIQ